MEVSVGVSVSSFLSISSLSSSYTACCLLLCTNPSMMIYACDFAYAMLSHPYVLVLLYFQRRWISKRSVCQSSRQWRCIVICDTILYNTLDMIIIRYTRKTKMRTLSIRNCFGVTSSCSSGIPSSILRAIPVWHGEGSILTDNSRNSST